MRILIQRVREASVSAKGKEVAAIGQGLLVFLGVEDADTEEDAQWLCGKLSKLRIFNDAEGVMNRPIMESKGSFLIISQFTLHASYKKGNRPSYIKAGKPDHARAMYEYFMDHLWHISDRPVKSGIFGADMKVALVNDGPVTIWMDSKNKE